MGQKVHPIGFRLGIVKRHTSVWYASGDTYTDNLINDLQVRKFLRKELTNASVSRIDIERLHSRRAEKPVVAGKPGAGARGGEVPKSGMAHYATVRIHTARSAMVIGLKAENVEKLRGQVAALMHCSPGEIRVEVKDIRKPELDAYLAAVNVAQQLERRVQFRRAMRRVLQSAMRQGAKGIRIRVAGRLGGADIARAENYREGRVPLHTLRADIDYATAEAATTYGVIGVKVWIFKGEVVGSKDKKDKEAPGMAADAGLSVPMATTGD